MSVRRFVNMLVSDSRKGMYSLRRFDMSRNQFFYPTAAEAAAHAKDVPIHRQIPLAKAGKRKTKQAANFEFEMESIRPPAPLVTMRPSPCPKTPSKIDCFPLSENKIFFADRSTRVFRFDADSRCIITMPNLLTPKRSPLALSIPGPRGVQQDDDYNGGGSLYIIERLLKPEMGVQFEALVYRERHKIFSMGKAWHRDTLPLPPFVHDPGYKPASICSYAVVGDVICISTLGVGTYCFDTVSHEWSRAGDWILPFYGKSEYVPELDLWFGVSDWTYKLPCAADLSPVVRGQQPEEGPLWEDFDRPEEWHPNRLCPAKIVSLGSGRFCITNFFETMERDTSMGELFVDETFAVFTGVEVLTGNGRNGKGIRGLRMIKHKSRRCEINNTNLIHSVL